MNKATSFGRDGLGIVAWLSVIALTWCIVLDRFLRANWPYLVVAYVVLALIGILYGPRVKEGGWLGLGLGYLAWLSFVVLLWGILLGQFPKVGIPEAVISGIIFILIGFIFGPELPPTRGKVVKP